MLAIFSTLLALNYHSQTALDRQAEEIQVARHMRVCVSVSSDFDTITTASPSEPILAEGALYWLSTATEKPVQMLTTVLGTSLVAAGERGEHVAALLLLMASNGVRGPGEIIKMPPLDFLKCLLGDKVEQFTLSVGGQKKLR